MSLTFHSCRDGCTGRLGLARSYCLFFDFFFACVYPLGSGVLFAGQARRLSYVWLGGSPQDIRSSCGSRLTPR